LKVKYVIALVLTCILHGYAWADVNLMAPINIEGSVGMSQYGLGADGTWRKDGYEQHNYTKDFAWSIALSQEPINYGGAYVGWEIGYIDLGNIHSHNLIPEATDGSGDSVFQNPSIPHVNQWNNGTGSVKGGILGITTRYKIYKELSAQIEGGLWLYWADWNLQKYGADGHQENYHIASSGNISYYYGGRIEYQVKMVSFYVGAKFFPDTKATTMWQGMYLWQGMYNKASMYEAGIKIPLGK